MNTVIFLSIDGLTDPLGQSQILPYLCALSMKGFKIHILSVEKKGNFQTNEKFVKEMINEAGIHWDFVFYSKKVPIYSQFSNYRALKRLCYSVIEKQNAKYVLHCRSYLPSLIGLSLKRKYNFKFLFDMRGFWADERAEAGTWNLKSAHHKFLYSYFKRKEAEFYSDCDHMVSLTEAAKADIISRFPKINPQKISVIPCCADLTFFNYQNFNIADKRNTLVYLGSLGTLYMIDEMIAFYAEYRKLFQNANFLILTPDSQYPLANLLKKHSIPQEEIKLEFALRKDVPAKISDCNAAIYFIRPSYSKKASSPTKCAELLGMGIPIITNSGIGDADALFSVSNCGYVISKFQAEEYHKACRFLLDTNFSKANLNKVAKDHFSLEEGVKKYEEIYLALNHE